MNDELFVEGKKIQASRTITWQRTDELTGIVSIVDPDATWDHVQAAIDGEYYTDEQSDINIYGNGDWLKQIAIVHNIGIYDFCTNGLVMEEPEGGDQ